MPVSANEQGESRFKIPDFCNKKNKQTMKINFPIIRSTIFPFESLLKETS